MDYDPIGNMLSGTTEASVDPVLAQQAYERDQEFEREEAERLRQQELMQQQEALAAQQPSIQEQAQQQENPLQLGNIGQNVQNAFEAPTALVGGLIDFADDTVEAVGSLAGQEWEFIPDDWGPQNKTPWGKALRSIVSFVGPTIGVSSLTKSGILQLAKMAKVANASKAVNLIGNLGVDMAAGTAVDVINRHSEGDNLVRTLKDNLGDAVSWLPDDWATLDTDSPDLKRNKNILEGAGLGLLGSIIEGGVAFARGLKGMTAGVTFKPIDDTAKKTFQEITNKSPQTKSMHPMLDRILKDEGYRQQHVDEMADVELGAIGGLEALDYYSPNIHSQISETYETLPSAVRPDAVPQMLVDNWRITNNIDTVYGRPAKFHTDAFLKSVDMGNLTSRKLVKELDQRIKDTGNFEVVLPNGRMANKKELLKAGDELAAKILDPSLQARDLYKLFDGFRDSIKVVSEGPSAKPINFEASAAAKSALKELKSFYLNMDMTRASAYWQTALAGESADLATASRVMGDAVDVSFIQERILDKMEALWFETDMAGSVHGWALNNEKIWMEAAKARSNNPAELAAFARESIDAFKAAKKLKAEQNRTFWVELKNMNKSNPKYVEPLMRAYELTDGNVNSLKKLNDYMKESLGVLNKAFVDGNPEIPSQVVQGMWATLYNAKLSSLMTPVKALSNNFALLLMKPMNVALGAAFRGDWKTLQRGWVQYATNMDTTMRASADYMGQMFRKVSMDPSTTQRVDFITKNNEQIELARLFADAEAAKGNWGPAMKMQFVETMQKINDHPWVRYSMNFMESGDAFVKSAVGMAEARGRAYDEFFTKYGRAPNAKEAQDLAADIYNKMFDKRGLLTDEAVKYSAGEIAMNLDNEFADGLNKMLIKAPLLKTLVMFPRTSVNVLDFVHKHSPLSIFMGDLAKIRNLKEADEIAMYMASKGQKYSDQAWKTMRAEVEGRVAMGTALVTMGGWMFASNNLTGNGKYDKQLNKFQQNAGERPLRSWKGPDGKWRSYDGIEPIATFLALTADIMDNYETLGATKTEHLMQKLGFAISMNLTNKSFLSGLQPITDLMAGTPGAFERWASNITSVGLFNQMSRAMMPGLREVDNDLSEQLRNKWNILDAAGIGESLPYSYDFIDGSIVGREDPLTNWLNNLLPFKTRTDPSPEKQFLIDAEFDVQPALKTSLKGVKYTAAQRSRLAQIHGEAGIFRSGLIELMKDPAVKQELEDMAAARSLGLTSEQADLSNTRTHTLISQLLRRTMNLAKRQLASEINDIRLEEIRAQQTRRQQRAANYENVLNLQNK